METEKVTEETLEGKRQARSFFLLKAGCFAAILLLAWLLSGFMRQAEAARLQQGISREVLRFHVLANSDSPLSVIMRGFPSPILQRPPS